MTESIQTAFAHRLRGRLRDMLTISNAR